MQLNKNRKQYYSSLHKWISRKYGKATYCANNKLHINTRFEWANISGDYLQAISDFKPLCASCHRKMDMTIEIRKRMSRGKIGNTNHAVMINQIDRKGNLVKKWKMIKTAAKELGICESAITNATHGRAKTAGGFIWEAIKI